MRPAPSAEALVSLVPPLLTSMHRGSYSRPDQCHLEPRVPAAIRKVWCLVHTRGRGPGVAGRSPAPELAPGGAVKELNLDAQSQQALGQSNFKLRALASRI